jgi:hypothetical protein
VNTEPEAIMDQSDSFTDARDEQGTTRLPALTAHDRCDAPGCSAQAYLQALLPSGRSLIFCGHHGHDLLPALAGQGADIRDDTHLLAVDRSRDAATPPN